MERIFAVDSIGVCCPALCALLHVGHRTAQRDHGRVSGGGANKATQRWPACTLVHDRCRHATECLPGLTMRAVGDRIAFKSSTEVSEQAEGLTRRAARSTLAAQPENAATRSLREEQAERSHVNLHVTGGVVRVRVPGQATVGTVKTGHSASPDQSRNTRKHNTQCHTPRVPTCSLLATDPRSRTPAQVRRPHRSPPAQPGRGADATSSRPTFFCANLACRLLNLEEVLVFFFLIRFHVISVKNANDARAFDRPCAAGARRQPRAGKEGEEGPQNHTEGVLRHYNRRQGGRYVPPDTASTPTSPPCTPSARNPPAPLSHWRAPHVQAAL